MINGLVVSTPPQEEWHTVTFMTAALHHTLCVVHAAGINALHVLHSMQSVWTTRAMSYCMHPTMLLWTNTMMLMVSLLPG